MCLYIHNIPNNYPEGCPASVFHQCLATAGSKRICTSQLHPYHIPIIFTGRSSHCAAPTGAIALPALCLTSFLLSHKLPELLGLYKTAPATFTALMFKCGELTQKQHSRPNPVIQQHDRQHLRTQLE